MKKKIKESKMDADFGIKIMVVDDLEQTRETVTKIS